MARRQTYGNSMAIWEEEKDKRDWKTAINKALNRKDYEEFELLVKEGLYCNYDFPIISDETAINILNSYF